MASQRWITGASFGSSTLPFSLLIPDIIIFSVDNGANVYYHNPTFVGTSGKYKLPVFRVIKSLTEQVPEVGRQEVFIRYSNDVEVACNLKLENSKNTLLPQPVNQHVLNVTQSSVLGRPSFCIEFPVAAQSLRSFMLSEHPDGLSEPQIIKALCWMLSALQYLHHTGHVHGAINSDHVYVDSDDEIGGKLAYGATVVDLDTMYGLCDGYVAPDDELYTRKTDIWYVGIVAVELAYGKLPPVVKRTKELLRKIHGKKKFPIKDKYYDSGSFIHSSVIPKIVKSSYRVDISPALSQLVARCLHPEASQRPTAEELLRSRPLRNGINAALATFFDPADAPARA